jgi:hypothetical protein
MTYRTRLRTAGHLGAPRVRPSGTVPGSDPGYGPLVSLDHAAPAGPPASARPKAMDTNGGNPR